jgi:FkbM family methyltransferase
MQTSSTCFEDLKPAPIWANIAASITRRLPRGKYRLIEWLCRGSNREFLGRMDPKLGGYTFECCLRDMLAREVFFAGCFAAHEIAFARSILRLGMSFVDLGANWGLFSLVASHLVGSAGHVVAVEADPRIFAKLKSNVERNHLNQVQVFEVAAADCDSHLILAAHDHGGSNWGTSRLVEASSKASQVFTVRSRRLDSLLDEAGLQGIDLLKVDVEGAEDMVLTGMEVGLRTKRYFRILLELHPRELAARGRNIRDVIGVLTTAGYKGYALDYSQAGVRKAYYRPWRHFSKFVEPLDQGLKDPSPHTVWLAPDQPDLL